MSKVEADSPWLDAIEIVRIGNRVARAVQQANRQLGIPNWYSLNGSLVSDASPPPRPSTPTEPRLHPDHD